MLRNDELIYVSSYERRIIKVLSLRTYKFKEIRFDKFGVSSFVQLEVFTETDLFCVIQKSTRKMINNQQTGTKLNYYKYGGM